MFSQRPCYFTQLSRAYPVLKLVDIYDRQSFVRTYVLDNIYVCVLMYCLFYAALWYATNIIKRIEQSNREMSATVAENKTKLDRLIMLKDKKAQFEEVIVKTTDTQKVTTRQLESEMHRLDTELLTTSNKIAQLEKFIEKYKRSNESLACSADVVAAHEDECPEGRERAASSPPENFKILEPSFPPSLPPEPPPRKYGIFVTRPPGQRRASSAAASPATPPPKVGLK